ncbi:Probable calcium-binding protein CML27 [Linum perenne]
MLGKHNIIGQHPTTIVKGIRPSTIGSQLFNVFVVVNQLDPTHNPKLILTYPTPTKCLTNSTPTTTARSPSPSLSESSDPWEPSTPLHIYNVRWRRSIPTRTASSTWKSSLNSADRRPCFGTTKELREAFNLYDENKDGIISEAELHQVMNRLGMKFSVE